MKFSKRMDLFKPSATLAVNAKALQLAGQGLPVINLAVGEPDFPTPGHIKQAAVQAIADNYSKYTAVPGDPELQQAVCGYYQRVYQVQASPKNVVVTNGGKQALYNLFVALLDPGDEVLIPAPYWTSYPDMVNLAGGTPVAVPASAQAGFRIRVEDLEQKRTDRTRILLINSPSNPTGVAYSAEELQAMLDWAVDHDIFVMSDEIYDQLVYPPAQPASACHHWAKYPDQTAIIHGLSKAFAMTGWRVGYTLSSPQLAAQMIKIQSQVTSNICSIAQKAAIAALNSDYACVDEMRQAFMRRRDLAYAEISTWPGVVCPKPEGAFYLFADVSNLFDDKIKSGSDMCEMLLDKAQVALVPGEAFGDPRCVRLSYATDDAVLREALTRIKSALGG